MKKVSTLLLSLLLVLGLAACGSGKKESKNLVVLDNHVGQTVSVERPEGFNEGASRFLFGTSTYLYTNEYVGEKYSFGVAFGKYYSNVGSMDKYLERFKSGNIAETKKINGKKAYIHQAYDSNLRVLIPYSKKHLAIVEIKLKDLDSAADFREVEKRYREFYKSKDVNKLIESIKLEKAERSKKAIKIGKASVEPVGMWYLAKEDKKRESMQMSNNDINDFTASLYFETYDKGAENYISLYESKTTNSTEKIGDLEYTVMQYTSASQVYFVTPVGDKALIIRANADLYDEAKKVIETIKIKK